MENDSTVAPHLQMNQWVIYAHPRDYPDKFVLRRWKISGIEMMPTDEIILADSLAEIREKVPPGYYRLQRFADDDPSIVEVWV